MNERRKSNARRPGGLTADDIALWRHVNRDTAPLKGRNPAPKGFEAPSKDIHLSQPDPPADGKSGGAASSKTRPSAAQAPSSTRDELLSHGSSAGLDRRNADRLKRGKMAIEATLDLHGMTQIQAHSVLGRFIHRCEARGLRCVLVITGKGSAKNSEGILRSRVPEWLNEPGLREHVIAFSFAQKGHGGTGALYVLLKRRRTE